MLTLQSENSNPELQTKSHSRADLSLSETWNRWFWRTGRTREHTKLEMGKQPDLLTHYFYLHSANLKTQKNESFTRNQRESSEGNRMLLEGWPRTPHRGRLSGLRDASSDPGSTWRPRSPRKALQPKDPIATATAAAPDL